jgi:hypothetical protein
MHFELANRFDHPQFLSMATEKEQEGRTGVGPVLRDSLCLSFGTGGRERDFSSLEGDWANGLWCSWREVANPFI